MIPRHAVTAAHRLARGFPILLITGPRQSGKTTLARALFADRAYCSLEDPEQRAFALEDPRGFLARFPEGAVIDEAQHGPQLMSYLQGLVDERRRMGDFVLTGSQQFGLMSGISQSLAGRVGRIELLPFSMAELAAAGRLPDSLDGLLWQGGYPPLYDRPVAPDDWFPNYIATYLERDVRQLLAVRDLSLFQRFVRLCAARSGQLLNLSALGNDAGVSHSTAREWLSVLEASYLIALLRPHHANFGKRLVKSPKLYCLDVGLAAALLGIKDADALNIHAQRGALFETLIISEHIKQRFNDGKPAALYFWRDNSGNEIDLLIDEGSGLRPIEIKSGATFVSEWLNGIRRWQRLAGEQALQPRLIYGGVESYRRDEIEVTAWRDLAGAVAAGP
jgi:predicted AAA+ superfamily ATPase